MAKFRQIWEVREDEEFGGIGLARREWPSHFNPCQTGDLLAHDILEHAVTNDLGTFENEIAAIGARAFVRGNWNCFNPNVQSGYAESLADEIVNQIRSYNIESVKPARRIVWGVIDYLIGDLGEFKWMIQIKCEQEDCEYPGWTIRDIRNIVRYAEHGYRAAERLYRNEKQGTLFRIVERIKEKFPKNIDIGMSFEININTDTDRVWIDEVYSVYED